MEDQIFKLGDIVQLKTGGSKMTVTRSGPCWTEVSFWSEILILETLELNTDLLQLADKEK
jgi:hypothetical protein